MNPTQDVVLEKRVAPWKAASPTGPGLRHGMPSPPIQTIAEAGDNIVSASTLYGGTYNLFAHTLPQWRHRGALLPTTADPGAFES